MTSTALEETHCTLRQATMADDERLIDAHRDSVHTLCAEAYSPAHIATWFEDRGPEIHHPLIADGRIWIAERGERILGFVGTVPGEVTHLFVRPEAAGLGLGRRLFEFGLIEAARDHTGPLTVVSSLNAQSFYANCGFVAVELQHFSRGKAALQYPVVKMTRASP